MDVATLEATRDRLALRRGAVEVEVKLHPLRIHVRRDGHRLLRALQPFVVDGEINDLFIQLTEGVIAHETLGFPEHVVAAAAAEHLADGLELALTLQGGRQAMLRITLPDRDHVTFALHAAGEPLRIGLEWDARPEEHFAGLGARHAETVDHHGRAIQLGADRRYTGPDCPPDMLEGGGIPQGDYAPVPWLQSSRGYALFLDTAGNGTRFDLGSTRERVAVSQRSRAGDVELHVYCDPSPAARLRRFLRRTGLPPVLAEWGYGFWKSRDVYGHQDDVMDDFEGCLEHAIPLDAIVLDSPWETQYNTWIPNPHQFPDFTGMVRTMRDEGVRTVVWVTPWTNLESSEGQIPDDPESRALHAAPASNYEDGREHFVRAADGSPFVAKWWMGTGSPVDFTSPDADDWWRAQARAALALGVEGIKADDGEGYYLPDDTRFADGTTGADAAWRWGRLYRASMQRALDEELGENHGVLFGRSGWTGQQAVGMLWGGDQASDFWSLRVLVAASLSAASTGFSNWSHDVGGYLGERLMARCPKELLIRWAQLGAYTPLMQAHGRMPQEPWTYDHETLALYRQAVVLHETLVPYVRAAAATCARSGLPILRPLSLVDPADDRGWSCADAYGYGPSLWVAPVLEDGARERETILPRGRWVETWSGTTVRGGGEVVVPAPLERIPVWVRHGALIATLPTDHVLAGLGDTPEHERPLEVTLWGEPACGRVATRLADGTVISWRRGRGFEVRSPHGERDVRCSVRAA